MRGSAARQVPGEEQLLGSTLDTNCVRHRGHCRIPPKKPGEFSREVWAGGLDRHAQSLYVVFLSGRGKSDVFASLK